MELESGKGDNLGFSFWGEEGTNLGWKRRGLSLTWDAEVSSRVLDGSFNVVLKPGATGFVVWTSRPGHLETLHQSRTNPDPTKRGHVS